MDLDILDAALGQPLPQDNWLGFEVQPYTVMCSTWQNPDGTFTEIMRRAEDQGIPIYQWCFRETSNPIDGWLKPETIASKKAMIPAEMWKTEYELNEPSRAAAAFDPDAVEAVFCLPFEPIEQKVSKDFEEYTFEKPERRGSYVASADWGKEHDYTVIMVGRVDVEPARLVYYMRVNRRPYPQMIGWFNKAINDYGATAIHDGTGLGNVVHDLVDIRARKFIMTGEKRSSMLTEYVSAIERVTWNFPKIKSAYLDMKYCRVGDLYKTTLDFHLPDSICAGALMNLHGRRGFGAMPQIVPRDSSPSKLQRHFKMPTDENVVSPFSPIEPEPEISFIVG